MTGLWWCLTPIVFLFSGGGWYATHKEDPKAAEQATVVSVLLAVPAWWALYWAIRLIAGTA